MSDEKSWDGQARHGLQLLGYSKAADASCDEVIDAISEREQRVREIEVATDGSDAANEHARLTGIELPDLRKLATEKNCAGISN